ncbi:CsgG/HfaB family protein [Spirochaetota bacterium]
MRKLLLIITLICSIFFAYPQAPAAKGKSLITQGAERLAGKISKFFIDKSKQKYRNNLAVYEFEAIGKEAKEKEIGKVASSIITTELKKTGTFDIIDRENIDKAVREMELGMSGLVDADSAVEVGKLVSAHLFLNGDVAEIEGTYIINIRMTLVATGRIIFTDKVEFPKDRMNSMSTLLLTEKKYPIIAGFQSALIPGWGQFYNDEPLNGAITLGLGAGAAGTAVTFAIFMNINKTKGDEWRAEYDSYKSWQTYTDSDLTNNQANAVTYFANAEEYYTKAEFDALIVNIALISYGTVWLYSVVQGILSASFRLSSIKKAQNDLISRGALLPEYFVYPYYDDEKTRGLVLCKRF